MENSVKNVLVTFVAVFNLLFLSNACAVNWLTLQEVTDSPRMRYLKIAD